jgi:hypothetical protein
MPASGVTAVTAPMIGCRCTLMEGISAHDDTPARRGLLRQGWRDC